MMVRFCSNQLAAPTGRFRARWRRTLGLCRCGGAVLATEKPGSGPFHIAQSVLGVSSESWRAWLSPQGRVRHLLCERFMVRKIYFPPLEQRSVCNDSPRQARRFKDCEMRMFLVSFSRSVLATRECCHQNCLQLFPGREGQPWMVVAPSSPALVRTSQGQRWWREVWESS